VNENLEIYVLDVEGVLFERAHVTMQHILLDHPHIKEVSMNGVRSMGYLL
jgi:hypothetical protein